MMECESVARKIWIERLNNGAIKRQTIRKILNHAAVYMVPCSTRTTMKV
jgi:hypothetical protein